MALTPASTNEEIITDYVKGANFYTIAEATRLSLEEVEALIQKAEDEGRLIIHDTAEKVANATKK